jgi:hypothetical protein
VVAVAIGVFTVTIPFGVSMIDVEIPLELCDDVTVYEYSESCIVELVVAASPEPVVVDVPVAALKADWPVTDHVGDV